MNKFFNPSVSVECLAAYLDGNLTAHDADEVRSLLTSDNDLQGILEDNAQIDETFNEYSGLDLDVDLLQEFELPEVENNVFTSEDEEMSEDSDISFIDESSVELQDEINNEINNELNNTTMAKTIIYGEAGENVKDPIFIQQPDDHSCALRSQQIILRDFGIDIPFQDLEQIALDAGVYTNNGTYTYDIGKVLELAGVGMHQVQGCTINDLAYELQQGHRVIVSVDANELWFNNTAEEKYKNWLEDAIGHQGGNHALIVAGIEVNHDNPSDISVVLTDPGSGDLRIEYPVEQFMDAWKDSNCFMAATDNPAPYQYDPETGMEVPSNFAIEQHFNQFITDNSYQLSPDYISIPMNYQAVYNGHLDLGEEDWLHSQSMPNGFINAHIHSDYPSPNNNQDIEEDNDDDVEPNGEYDEYQRNDNVIDEPLGESNPDDSEIIEGNNDDLDEDSSCEL